MYNIVCYDELPSAWKMNYEWDNKNLHMDSFTLSCLATSFADEPETSIHVFENSAQADSMKTT